MLENCYLILLKCCEINYFLRQQKNDHNTKRLLNLTRSPDRRGILFFENAVCIFFADSIFKKKDIADSWTPHQKKTESVQLQIIVYFYIFPSRISSTISGFKSVEISPKLAKSPSAIFRRIRLMILPERVLGSPVTN